LWESFAHITQRMNFDANPGCDNKSLSYAPAFSAPSHLAIPAITPFDRDPPAVTASEAGQLRGQISRADLQSLNVAETSQEVPI